MQDQSMLKQMVMGFLRHAITVGAGSLVASGVISQSQLETLVGGVLVTVAIGWSLWDKRKTVALNNAKNEIIQDQRQVIEAKSAVIEGPK